SVLLLNADTARRVSSRCMLSPRCVCFVSSYGAHLDLHSFPTRRSSDLIADAGREVAIHVGIPGFPRLARLVHQARARASFPVERSEEHTSELQSRENLVCRLLLEKKNKKTARSSLQAVTYSTQIVPQL